MRVYHLSDGCRSTYQVCPNCDRSSHPASAIGLCPKCFVLTYDDARQLIAEADSSEAFRRERSEHSAKVEVGGRATVRKPGWVYFYRVDDKVKIGWSADPAQRVKAFGPGELLATIPGFLADESAVHRRFDLLRLHGEWFAYTPALRRYVSDLAAEAA